MNLTKTRSIYFILILVSQSFAGKDDDEDEPEGIESDEGDAKELYNKTYIEHQTKLDQDLWKGYKTSRIPVKNASQPITIMMHWHLTHINIIESDQTMGIHGHLYMTWMDEFLGWDPANYNGIRQTRCKKWQVWSPKVRIANSISGLYSNFDISSNSHVIVATHGTDRAKVEMYPTFAIKVGCNLDFSDYPNDEHNCTSSAYVQQPMSRIRISPYFMTATVSLAWDKLSGNRKNKMMISNFKIVNVTNTIHYYRNGSYYSIEPITTKEQAQT
ncbi:hypothetical protein WR25_14469 [Diploscapter pachys]|uniref:Neurotransmitter-gated ion-channel ligand-binding domain-containing protein n=1 Tax=Diploscapter pachys TaxID=2018661 RepID=A0A2A2LCV1_9BILA|nr:hypothetical protein WR25_14469 [Diploscapter pachys]